MSTDEQDKTRRLYGRGYHDGFEAAKRNKETPAMTTARNKNILDGLTGTSRKVYEALPLSESWPVNKIIGELRRRGINTDVQTVMGCLAYLLDHGCAKEPMRGQFIRVELKTEDPAAEPPVKKSKLQFTLVDSDSAQAGPPPATPVVPPAPLPSPASSAPPTSLPVIDSLAALAASLRATAATLLQEAKDVEELALRLESDNQSTQADKERMRQFKALLGELAQ